ncbi:MAG: methyltransferase domain-containing protein [Erysipelotrichaceae bacterium]
MLLKCPVCQAPLIKDETLYRCSKNHSFDIAKPNYLNLYLNQGIKAHGDNALMIKARHQFLHTNHYQRLLDTLIQLIKQDSYTSLVDLGSGEGYYTNHIQRCFPKMDIVGIDLSKQALKLASQTNQDVQYVCASIHACPLFDQSSDLILSIFSPYKSTEVIRILKDGGSFIEVKPASDHLYQLKQKLYTIVSENPNNQINLDELKLIQTFDCKFTLNLNQVEIENLLKMTPYFYTSHPDNISSVLALDSLIDIAHFTISHYRLVKKN